MVVQTLRSCRAPHKQQVKPLPIPSQGSAQHSLAPWDGSTPAEVCTDASSNTDSCTAVHVPTGKLAYCHCHWGKDISKISACGKTVEVVPFHQHHDDPSLASWCLVWIKILTTQKLTANEQSEITTFPWTLFSFFSLSQSLFVLAHWWNTSFHASQQQCYPVRCKKGGERTKGIFHADFWHDQLTAKTVNVPRYANPHVPSDLTGKTAALRSSQGRWLFWGSLGCGVWQGCHNLLWCSTKPFYCDSAHQTDCSTDPKDQCLEALQQVLLS